MSGRLTFDCAAKTWGYKLSSFDSGGVIQKVYKTEEHYPAPRPPDDSGPLANVHRHNWKEILRDLTAHKYDTPEVWYAYMREDLHEEFHWNVQWTELIVELVAALEGDLEEQSVPFALVPSAAAATGILETVMQHGLALRYNAALETFAKIPDNPGKGSPAYDAAAVGVQKLIDRVSHYVTANGWASETKADGEKPTRSGR